jgi:hypothetical protein
VLALIRKKSFCRFDAHARQPEQTSGDEISHLLEERLASRGIHHVLISEDQFNISLLEEGGSACA